MRPGQQLHDSEAADRAGRGRLLRYCARAPFTLDRPRDPERLLYESTKARPEQERSAAPDAAGTHRPPRRLVPPQRVHRHRYFGVLTRTAAHGKFPRRSRTAAPGRHRPVTNRTCRPKAALEQDDIVARNHHLRSVGERYAELSHAPRLVPFFITLPAVRLSSTRSAGGSRQ